MPLFNVSHRVAVLTVFVLASFGLSNKVVAQAQKPRGEIRVVENWRPDISVLGHNVLQYLFEYALDSNQLAPSLAVNREWIDDTTLEVKLCRGVRFHNGEVFNAHAVKFNLDYQREHNPNRGVQAYMKNVKEIQVVDPYTVRMILDQPDGLFPSGPSAAQWKSKSPYVPHRPSGWPSQTKAYQNRYPPGWPG